ncbi:MULTISPECIES: proline dehydrogenase family protein [Streptomyces]|uniref:proline dehydrogenase n=1 Tax=Streptomyces chartreusis NRRL 3882 TaxID=1079985 RepID=A0A2N9B1Z4_STRCX|nr:MULTISPECIES: proline dehydrogenase family protein [Streptomyces]MYS92371.1 proline dehydrogenase [Streptomyces sp. SID5464]SOR77369.1 Proline dehydrogenase 1 [Streptomyces chartreusis NRRL 3882]
MLRRVLLFAARQDRVHTALRALPASRAVVDRFVAGETPAEAVAGGSALVAERLCVTYNSLGEYETDPARTLRTRDAFVAFAGRLADAGLGSEVSELSVKLSALGQLNGPGGPARALDHARVVCAAAKKAGVLVTLDMEDHTTTDSTLEIARELRRDFPLTGVAVQAALRRTPADCADLQRAGARVRLVKGAYREPASVAFQRRADVDRAFVRCLRTLFAGDARPLVATHDPRLIGITTELARRHGRRPGQFEHQMLYGVRGGEQRRLAAAGHRVRVYLPFGPEWYGYFTRRLAERPANTLFFLRALARPS